MPLYGDDVIPYAPIPMYQYARICALVYFFISHSQHYDIPIYFSSCNYCRITDSIPICEAETAFCFT